MDGLLTVNLARYRPTGEHVAIRRIDLESCTNDMVTYLQVCISTQSHQSAMTELTRSLCLAPVILDTIPLLSYHCFTGNAYVTFLSVFRLTFPSSLLIRFRIISSSLPCRLDIIRCNFLLPAFQGELHVSKLFHHHSILPYKSIFIAENELWVITPFMAYGNKIHLNPQYFIIWYVNSILK